MTDNSPATELLPCPFCGGKAEFERLGTPRQSTIVACTTCGARLESGEEWGYGRDWNTRIRAETAKNSVEQWRCTECQGRSYAVVQDVNGNPTNQVRCVNCKHVSALTLLEQKS